jgi:hypothetical protein
MQIISATAPGERAVTVEGAKRRRPEIVASQNGTEDISQALGAAANLDDKVVELRMIR